MTGEVAEQTDPCKGLEGSRKDDSAQELQQAESNSTLHTTSCRFAGLYSGTQTAICCKLTFSCILLVLD